MNLWPITKTSPLPDDMLITVCAECLTSACWNSVFYCDKYKTADVCDLPVKELRKMDREHPSYWEKDWRAVKYRDEQRRSGK